MKLCHCGRAYEIEGWSKLPLVGYMSNGRDAAGELIELRQCACGTSIAIDLGEEPDSVPRVRVRPKIDRGEGA